MTLLENSFIDKGKRGFLSRGFQLLGGTLLSFPFVALLPKEEELVIMRTSVSSDCRVKKNKLIYSDLHGSLDSFYQSLPSKSVTNPSSSGIRMLRSEVFGESLLVLGVANRRAGQLEFLTVWHRNSPLLKRYKCESMGIVSSLSSQGYSAEISVSNLSRQDFEVMSYHARNERGLCVVDFNSRPSMSAGLITS